MASFARTLSVLLALFMVAPRASIAATTQIALWGQCGGKSGTPPKGVANADSQWATTACTAGTKCYRQDQYYWQCRPAAASPAPTPSPVKASSAKPASPPPKPQTTSTPQTTTKPSTVVNGTLPAWRTGRATFYGTDGWSINKGSCEFGALPYNPSTEWDVTAIASTNPFFLGHDGPQCGGCFEVRCKPMNFKDGYGATLERTQGICKDPSASVMVKITDTCDCTYAANAYSNKRWCCGDMEHLDMSIWAFEKLADTKWGVIGLSYRPVPCDYKPAVVAAAPVPSTPRKYDVPLPPNFQYTCTTPPSSAQWWLNL